MDRDLPLMDRDLPLMDRDLPLMDRDLPLWLNTPAREILVADGRAIGVRG